MQSGSSRAVGGWPVKCWATTHQPRQQTGRIGPSRAVHWAPMGTGKRLGLFQVVSVSGHLNQKTPPEQGFLEMELGGFEPPTS